MYTLWVLIFIYLYSTSHFDFPPCHFPIFLDFNLLGQSCPFIFLCAITFLQFPIFLPSPYSLLHHFPVTSNISIFSVNLARCFFLFDNYLPFSFPLSFPCSICSVNLASFPCLISPFSLDESVVPLSSSISHSRFLSPSGWLILLHYTSVSLSSSTFPLPLQLYTSGVHLPFSISS